ncbi:ACP S-malonyltransferase [Cellulomonas shaoxiangyii]|uniref:ACP S-malonyltransferase n=1 Tax=Cellulomonas shaoxiangyii TaxID=2566013 RepID=A0A4P7SM21_9CELL|nr:ACP S-malonyltransferase [Cellulomonas shaoxiangyii]QCB95011.1 ACP S-malonyltransferase [Cellulomonas shaoxiangyii]TGY86340.1 ACP S-malonyltransferase [Cellulomonas shaoxiangyii]
MRPTAPRHALPAAHGADTGDAASPSVLLFSGFGASGPGHVRQLQELYRRPSYRPLLEAASDAVDRAVHRFGEPGVQHLLPGGIPLRAWLRAATPPPAAALRLSAVEGVLTHLSHLCLLQPDEGAAAAAHRAAPTVGPATGPVVGLGHSLGLISAVVAGLRREGGQQFLRDAHESMTMTVLTLLRCQEAAGDQRPDPALARRYGELGGGRDRPGPMAAVSGVDVATVRDLVAEHHAGGGQPVEVGLVNGPRDAVLCGSPTGLLELWSRQQGTLAGAGASWAFLNSSVPFHNSRLAPVLDHLAADREWAKASISGERLAAPVYATDEPRNLQQVTDLYTDCLSQVICRPLDWTATLRSVMAEHRPSRVYDFGPGVAVRMFTRKYLEQRGHALEYVSVRSPPAR